MAYINGHKVYHGVVVLNTNGSRTIKLGSDEICEFYAIGSDGATVDMTGTNKPKYACSSFIDCYDVDKITLKRPQEMNTGTGYGTAFYDANKSFLSFVANPIGSAVEPVMQTIDVPSGAYYFRTTYYNFARRQDFDDGEFVCTMTVSEELMPNGKRPYQAGQIFFSPTVNNGISDYTSTENASIVGVDYKNTTGALWLPESYTANGKPTKLIMYVHGQGQFVHLDRMASTELLAKYQEFVDAGFAVFACNGARNNNKRGNFAGLGLPQFNEAYHKCYEYILEHYNIAPQIYLIGASMGGLTALSYARQYSNTIRAFILLSAWTNLYECVWDNDYPSTSTTYWKPLLREYVGTDVYSEDVFRGIAPELEKITIDNTDYIRPFNFPVYAMNGTNEQTTMGEAQAIPLLREFMTALKNTGSNVQHREIDGLTHDEVVRDATPVVDNDIINWFKAH